MFKYYMNLYNIEESKKIILFFLNLYKMNKMEVKI